jgi:poly-gamma-glutamate capsule biosynthesis protein CapA/YwtB (metallophosphatase superfamily)
MSRLRGKRGQREAGQAGSAKPGGPAFRLSLASLIVFVALVGLTAWAPLQGQTAPDLAAYPWLYLRDGQAPAPGEKVVEVIAVGDVMLGRGVAGVADPLSGVAPLLRGADLALGNLECVIGEGGTSRPGPYRLRAPSSAAGILREAGFDLLGLANNHALDYGSEGLAETVSRLQEAGIGTVGAGPDPTAAAQPVIREAGGLRLAFLAFNAIRDPDDMPGDGGWTRAMWDEGRAANAIAVARAEADAVIVSLHWGYEYAIRPDPAQRDAARALLDAGADLVIGHHPHVVQGTEVRAGGFAVYSLGNLAFDQQQAETRQGLALRAFFDSEGLRAVQALPLWAGPHPRLMLIEESAALLARVEPSLLRLGFACDLRGCRSSDVSQIPAVGLFRAGTLDLTGDGFPERVQRVGGQAVVYHQGSEAWRSPPEWQVVDLALGDPNDDGRGELLLALWQADAGGVPRSQPFVVGYRQGAYRLLWAGSAVADPIREVELGDVDGDGVQELIVLEERGDDQAVSVWRWHGWGFSLVWRSPPGRYRDLALASKVAGQPPAITVSTLP